MERDFGILSDFSGGRESHCVGVSTPGGTIGVDEAYLNGCFSDLGFQSILQPVSESPSLNYYFYSPYEDGVSVTSSSHSHYQASASSYGYFEENLPATEIPPPPNTYPFTNQDLKMPKHEPLNTQDFAFQLLKLNNTAETNAAGASPEPFINFFPPASDVAVARVGNTSGGMKALETKEDAAYQTGSLNDILNVKFQHQLASTESSSTSKRVNSAMKRYVPYCKPAGMARQRRQKLSEKTRRLQRLLPWDQKMDMGTMLEEAYKYIKFLQAQIIVLQTMPLQSSRIPAKSPSCEVGGVKNDDDEEHDVVCGELGKLNRQQLLQVLVNSPVAQTLLYSRGCCVYSMEQLALLKQIAEKKALWEQVLFAPPIHFQY